MTHNRKSPSLSIIAAIAFVIFVWLNWFPPGGIDEELMVESVKTIPKSEAAAIAEEFITSNYNVDKLDSIVSFNSYQDANGYLLREQVFHLYKSSWKSSVPIDYFQVLTQDKNNELRFKVYVQMDDGRIFGWQLLNPEQYTGASQVNKSILITNMGYDTNAFTLSKDSNEIEYVHHQVIGEASLQLQVSQQGDVITGLMPAFQLPESYTTWKDRQDQLGITWSLFSQLLWFGLAIAAIVYMTVYRKMMNFGRGVLLTLAFLIPYLIHNVNMYPGYMLMYSSSIEALSVVLLSQFIMMLMAVTVYLSFVAGDGMWKRLNWHLWPTSKEHDYGSIVVTSMGQGYLISIIVLGLQSSLFFLGGYFFDIWSTSDPLMSTHNLLAPSLFPLLAWSAAISEEAVFRLFGIVFFVYVFQWISQGLFRITGLALFQKTMVHLIPAIVISNMIWALGHTGYTIYPVYTRFIEVSLLGFVFAYALLRYGLITAIFAHASVDIIIMGLQIMMNGPSYVMLGLTYMIMPALIAWLINFLWKWRNSRPQTHPHSNSNN